MIPIGLWWAGVPGFIGAVLTMGYRLFHAPLPLDDYWLLLVLPMVVAISVVYKAIKLEDLSQLPHQAALLVVQIIFFLVLAASGLWLITALA